MKRLKSFHRIVFLPVLAFAINISANPVAIPVISELKVITPQTWQMEINRQIFPKDSIKDSIKIKTSRYSDTFKVILSLPAYSEKFIVINQDSIKPTQKVNKMEIQKGDTITIRGRGFSYLVVNVMGADSSICSCGGNSSQYAITDTPTIGSDNKFPVNVIKLYILSKIDSVPVWGYSLYVRDMNLLPTIKAGNLDDSITLTTSPCNAIRYDVMDAVGNHCGIISYNYAPGALPRKDTLFVTPPTAVENENFSKKKLPEISITTSPSQLIFVIKGTEYINGQANFSVTTVSGKQVKEIPVNIAQSGTYSVGWDRTDAHGKHLSTGVYLAKLEMSGNSISKKFVLK